ncbi:MAG: hypothetical protein ABGY41_12050 [Candidatus Poribacteria bacterium]
MPVSAKVIRAKHITDEWPTVLTTRLRDRVRDGDRYRMQRVGFRSRSPLVALTLAECIAGDGRFTDDIANGARAICDVTCCAVSARIDVQKAGGRRDSEIACEAVQLNR